MKTIQNCFVALALGLAVYLPVTTLADSGIVSEAITAYKPATDLSNVKEGDTVAKVCNDCKHVTVLRIVKIGRGKLEVTKEKCEYCGSTNVYFATVTDKASAK